MTKQEALEKIKELQAYVEGCGKNKLEIEDDIILINRKWAVTLMSVEDEGKTYEGCKRSGHKASLFINSRNYGTWYDESGDVVDGYLYWKPNNEH